MGTKQYDSATDLITFSRASGGTALSKISYGNELVTNGTFDTDATGWVGNNSYYSPTIESQRLKVFTGASVQWNYAQTSISGLTIGKMYRFQASSFVGTSARHRISLGTVAGQSYDIFGQGLGVGSSQTVDTTFTATTTVVYVSLQNTDGVNGSTTFFDNVSIKEVLFDQADGTLQLYNYPNNIPRIEYDAAGAVKGLLIEEARTNLLPYSSVLGYSKLGVATSTPTVVSPSGLQDAVLVRPTVATGITWVYLVTVFNTGVVTTISTFAKASGKPFVAMSNSNGSVVYASFNLTTGAVGTVRSGYTANMEDFGNGWYRCSVTTPTGFDERAVYAVSDTDGWIAAAANGNDGILLYGAQIEAGAFLTSYIPTTGASATRARDIAEIPTSAFGYNNDKGSLVIDVLTPVADQIMPLAIFNTSSYFSSRSLYKINSGLSTSGDYFAFNTYDGATTQFTIGQQTQAEYTKLGLSYGDSERAARDGGTVLSGPSRYPNPTRLHLGGRDTGLQSQCWIKSIQYYPRQLTDTQLQEITAAGSSLRAYALGNSTVGPAFGQPSVISLVTTSNTKVNVAVPGDTIAEQKADWNSLSVNSLGTAWVVLQVGLNDLNPAVGTTASKIAEIQDLVDTIKADIGSKPLYIAKMLPCKERLVDVYGAATAALSQQRWVDMNEAIAGNGSSPITGVQGRIVSHVPLMDDGLGNLKAVYDLGDHIHPNTAGRQIMATAWEEFTT